MRPPFPSNQFGWGNLSFLFPVALCGLNSSAQKLARSNLELKFEAEATEKKSFFGGAFLPLEISFALEVKPVQEPSAGPPRRVGAARRRRRQIFTFL